MINVRCKKCIKCKKKCASFNYEGKSPQYCGDCKLDNMINVISKKCIKCKKKIPNFNFKDLSPEYCGDCKLDNMINVRCKKCIKCKNKEPNFNFKDLSPEYCGDCKLDNMINVKDKKCIKCKNKRPNFNFKDLSPKYCGDCKLNNMMNVKNKKCKSNKFGILCPTRGNKYYDNFCVHCFTNRFPEHTKTKSARKKNKEIAVKNYLYENGHSDFIHDKPIYIGDCSTNRRVDLYKYIGDQHILCLEIDENQHKIYNKKDEEQRYNDLYRIGYNMIYIRYNPDKYKDKKKKNRNPKFENRMNILLNEIKEIIKDIKEKKYNEELLYIKYLYYNEI